MRAFVVEHYVNERLAILARAKHGLQTRNWVSRCNYEWASQLGVHRLKRDGASDACVCQPVNDVGEPCAGEPHARFDAAAGGAPAPVGTGVRR